MKLRFVVRALSLQRNLLQTLDEEHLRFYGERGLENESFSSVVSSLRTKDLTFFFLDARKDLCKDNLREELEDFFRCCAEANRLQNSFIVLVNSDEYSREKARLINPVIELYNSCERFLVMDDHVTDDTLVHLATRVHQRSFEVPRVPCEESLHPLFAQRLALPGLLITLLFVGSLIVPPHSNFNVIQPQTKTSQPTNIELGHKSTEHVIPTRTESASRPQPAPMPQPTFREGRSHFPSAFAEKSPKQLQPRQTKELDFVNELLQEPYNEQETELLTKDVQLTVGDAKLFLKLLRAGVSLLEADVKNTSSRIPNPQESLKSLREVEEQLRQSEHTARILAVELAEQRQMASEQQRHVQEAKGRRETLQKLSDFMANEVELLHRIMKQQRGIVNEAELKGKMERMWKNVEEKGEAERQVQTEEERLREYEEKERLVMGQLQVAEKVRLERERERETRKREAYMLKLEVLKLSKEKEDKEKALLNLRARMKKWEDIVGK